MEFNEKILQQKPMFCFAFVFYSSLTNNIRTNSAVAFLDFAPTVNPALLKNETVLHFQNVTNFVQNSRNEQYCEQYTVKALLHDAIILATCNAILLLRDVN